MIKLIKRFQIKLTPFDAIKSWEMSTTNNQNLLLHDTGSYVDAEVPVALEFIDYGGITDLPSLNYECNIALEQQEDDLVLTRVGLKNSGLFFPETEPINEDGTYKRVIYSQVKTMFYNDYKDPTKTWGINNIDFNLSKTQRKINDEFKLFDVPQMIYGDKIIPNSIIINDRALDTEYIITDDGDGNLIAGTNLFSKQQELGKFENVFEVGKNNTCDNYLNFYDPPTPTASSAPINLTASLISTPKSASLVWTDTSNDEIGFGIERSVNSGPYSIWGYTSQNISLSIDTSIVSETTYSYRVYSYNAVGNSDYSNTASVFYVTESVQPELPVTDSLLAHIDFSDVSTTFKYGDFTDPAVAGNYLGGVLDKSENGNHLYSDSLEFSGMEERGSLEVGQNGLNVVKFSYTETAPERLRFPKLYNVRTIFMVLKSEIDTDTPCICDPDFLSGVTTLFDITGPITSSTYISTVLIDTGSFTRATALQIGSDKYRTLSIESTNNLTVESIGFGATGSVFAYGWIGEIILYSSALSAPNVATMNAYLTSKWAIT